MHRTDRLYSPMLLLLAACSLASAEDTAEPPVLVERGHGRLTYVFWKIYDVSLSLPVSVPSTDVLGDHPRRLTFT